MDFLAIGRPTGRTMPLPPLFERTAAEDCPAFRRAVGRLVRRRAEEHRKTGVVDAVRRPRSGPSRDRLSPGSAQRRWSERAFGSGGGRESNPPASFRPPTDFEGMSGLLAAFRPVTRAFVFRRRPRTCKDL